MPRMAQICSLQVYSDGFSGLRHALVGGRIA
jgi:hypothetical protein